VFGIAVTICTGGMKAAEQLASANDITRSSYYHGICKRGRDSYYHPPDYTNQKVPALSPNQIADQSSIQLSNIETYEGPNHEKEAVTYQQPQLFTLPSWDDNL